MADLDQPPRLDPDRAIEAVRGSAPEPPRRPPPVIDTRRYQWMIGGFGLALLIIFSIVLWSSGGGSSTPGVAPGQRLHRFVAPLATSDIDRPANAHPVCNPARPARHGLNVCGHRPIVLALFALHGGCVGAVNALQSVSQKFPQLQFGAVAVAAGRADTARLVRRHGWRIPVAFDMTGVIGQIYGVSVCPIIEMAGTGGVVARRLIGYAWDRPGALAAQVAGFARMIGAGSAG